jgi:hypothetical protein
MSKRWIVLLVAVIVCVVLAPVALLVVGVALWFLMPSPAPPGAARPVVAPAAVHDAPAPEPGK